MTKIEQLDESIATHEAFLATTLQIKNQAKSLFALQDMHATKETELQEMIANKKREQEQTTQEREYAFQQQKQQTEHERNLEITQKKQSFYEEQKEARDKLEQQQRLVAEQQKGHDQLQQEFHQLQEAYTSLEETLTEQISKQMQAKFESEKILLMKNFEIKERVAQVQHEQDQQTIQSLNQRVKEMMIYLLIGTKNQYSQITYFLT